MAFAATFLVTCTTLVFFDLDFLPFEVEDEDPEPEPLPPPPPTVMICGAEAATVFGVELTLLWPISTPTPRAISSVATPATSVAPEEARGRRGGVADGADGGAGAVVKLSAAKRERPRRSPQFTQ